MSVQTLRTFIVHPNSYQDEEAVAALLVQAHSPEEAFKFWEGDYKEEITVLELPLSGWTISTADDVHAVLVPSILATFKFALGRDSAVFQFEGGKIDEKQYRYTPLETRHD